MALVLGVMAESYSAGQGISGESEALRQSGETGVQAQASPQTPSPASEKPARSALGNERPAGATEITASEAVTFESEESMAVFTGDVVVRDPQFTLTAQRLTAYLSQGSNAGSDSEKDEGSSGGLSKAIAEGNVVIVQIKKSEDGKTKRYEGRGQKVVYDARADEVVLSGTPQVREGINIHMATSPSTVITIKTDGKLVTRGPSKTVISNTKAD